MPFGTAHVSNAGEKDIVHENALPGGIETLATIPEEDMEMDTDED